MHLKLPMTTMNYYIIWAVQRPLWRGRCSKYKMGHMETRL